VASPDGIAGVFDSTGGGSILSLRANGVEKVKVSGSGDLTTQKIFALEFFGNGGGLTNIPNSATTADSGAIYDTIVLRDSQGNFGANQIYASKFIGQGSGLTNIPNSATTATSGALFDSIVLRDSQGNFGANQIYASKFIGEGSGLTNIPNSATTAASGALFDTIVLRDNQGNFGANQIYATRFIGEGSGLTNIPNSATTATSSPAYDTIVLRNSQGDFAGNQIYATRFIGEGSGLTNIPNSATTATSSPASNTIVLRNSQGDFGGNQIFATKFIGDGSGLSNIVAQNSQHAIQADTAEHAVQAVSAFEAGNANKVGGYTPNQLARLSEANTFTGPVDLSGAASTQPIRAISGELPDTCVASKELILKTDAPLGRQLFLCGPYGNTWYGIAAMPSFSPATMFYDTNESEILNITQRGNGFAINALSSGNGIYVESDRETGTAFRALQTWSTGPTVGVFSSVQSPNGVAGIFQNEAVGGILSARYRGQEVFTVDTSGAITADSLTASGNVEVDGALVASIPGYSLALQLNRLVRFSSYPGSSLVHAGPTDTAILGVVIGLNSSSSAKVALTGVAPCYFDGYAQWGNYVANSPSSAGSCHDVGPDLPENGVVIGRVMQSNSGPGTLSNVYLFGPESSRKSARTTGTVTAIGVGDGLFVPGPAGPTGLTSITTSGTIAIANGGVTNAMLQNNNVYLNLGPGLAGSSSFGLGGGIGLTNTGVLSFNGRAGSVLPTANDYSFSQISGSASAAQLPSTLAYTGQANTFTSGKQTFAPSTASNAAVNIGSGAAPTALTSGDIWNESGSLKLYDGTTVRTLSYADGSISGNATTVTNGVYTTGAYSDPAWITTLAGTKVTGAVANATNAINATNASTVTNGVYTTGVYADPAWITAIAGSKITGPVASATNVTGIIATTNGGTGLTSSGAAGSYLRSNGSGWAASPIVPADLPDLSAAYLTLGSSQTVASAKSFTSASNAFTGTFTTGGTNPSASGAVRLSSADAIKVRNNANSADLNVVSKDAADVLTLGDTAGVVTAGKLTIANGIGNNGSGLKHKRVAACATTNQNWNACDVLVSWTTAFSDTNYTATCSLGPGTAAPSGRPTVFLQAKTANSVTVRIMNVSNTITGGTGAEIDCIAIHD
jgi:hypothetical protein